MTTPSLRDLEYFCEVVQTGTISRAAERLGISQPSLTAAVQRLERDVGAALLHRAKQGVSLTPSGKLLSERARGLIANWLRVRDGIAAVEHDVAGRYVVGCHHAVAAYTLPHCLPPLHRAHPRLQINLVHDLSRRIVEQVVSMQIDVGIVINPLRHPDLVVRKIRVDEVTLWQGGPVSPLHDLHHGAGVLLCDPELLQTQALQREFAAGGWHFGRQLHSADLAVLAGLVAAGCGTGILPASVAAQHTLRRVHPAPVYHDELCLIFRMENKNVPAIMAIGAAVEQALAAPQYTGAKPNQSGEQALSSGSSGQ